MKEIRCYCHSCGQDTRHSILHSVEIKGDDSEYFWRQSYRIARCCGCDELTFLRSTEEEGCVDDDGNVVLQHETYPYSKDEVETVEMHYVPYPIHKVYNEAVKAYSISCPLLAAAGFRATIEAVCKDKAITGKTLEQRINNLQKKGFITIPDRDRLHAIRFLGNDSIHDMKEPKRNDLSLLLEIVNNALNNLYVLDAKTCDMEKTISNFNDFIELLEVRLYSYKAGDVATLEDILKCDRRIMKEEKVKFESELISNINAGIYQKLALEPQQQGQPQKYKVS